MAKKADLLEKAAALGVAVTERNTIAEIEEAIRSSEDSSAAEATPVDAEPETFAKAGKRSAKAQAEVTAKLEKESRKEAGDTTPQDPDAEAAVKKGPAPKVRPRIERRGKKYQAAAKTIKKGTPYSLVDAVKLAVTTSPVSFDASIEVHARLGVDPRQADQNIRATVNLPHGTGKTVRVAAFVAEEDKKSAKDAGADIVGDAEFLSQLDKEDLAFDVLITTPKQMPKLGKYARLLGPRGLMPNPKAGTVATDVAAAVTDAKAGKVEYRVDKQSIVHIAVGKVSFGETKVQQNIETFLASLEAQKPSTLKGSYVKTLYITTSMGPSILLENTIN